MGFLYSVYYRFRNGYFSLCISEKVCPLCGKQKRPPIWRPFLYEAFGLCQNLLESGIITQQQFSTIPVVAKIISLALLFREFHKSEIRLPIPTRSVGSGA